MCADGVISVDELAEDRERLIKDKVRLEQGIESLEDESPATLIEQFRSAVSFANLAKIRFREGDVNQKRQILQSVSSNISLEGKTALIQAKEPFASYMKMSENPDEYTWRNTIRTLIEQ